MFKHLKRLLSVLALFAVLAGGGAFAYANTKILGRSANAAVAEYVTPGTSGTPVSATSVKATSVKAKQKHKKKHKKKKHKTHKTRGPSFTG